MNEKQADLAQALATYEARLRRQPCLTNLLECEEWRVLRAAIIADRVKLLKLVDKCLGILPEDAT